MTNISDVVAAGDLVLEELILKSKGQPTLPTRAQISAFIENTLGMGHNVAPLALRYLETKKKSELKAAGYTPYRRLFEDGTGRYDILLIPSGVQSEERQR